jgi:ATP-dependent Clp protease ATP-binding subunit ClpA
MAERSLPITLVIQSIDEEILCAEPLLFPEIRQCDTKRSRLRTQVKELAKKVAEGTQLFVLHGRELPGGATSFQVDVTLDPPKRQTEWQQPVTLRFDVVRWQHGNEALVAFVPALGIEVVAAKEPQLLKMIPDHITAALRRSRAAESLYELALTQRAQSVKLEPLQLPLNIRSAKQIEQEEGKEDKPKPAIEEVGLVLTAASAKTGYELDATVAQIADALAGRNAKSVLLVGPSGVGKTAAVHELVRQSASHAMGSTPFWSTSGSRLMAGMSGFGMWQQRCQRLCKEAAAVGAVVHLGNLVELIEVGRGGGGGQGIASFLRPYLQRGDILSIVECTPEQFPLIEREDPHLLEVFHQIGMEEPSTEAGRKILHRRAESAPRPRGLFAEGWLDTLDRLHRRYATYSAYPGRPLRFLDNLIADLPRDEKIEPSHVISAFARETGLPRFMLDPAVPLDLDEVRRKFSAQVIGQEAAVNLMTDLLATVKAALTRPRKPIASLLFIGPTGVGKTELAKALAEFFFGDRNRLTRFDMSEFASPSSVQQLIGGVFGAEGRLTAKVREQPFSVILFDEFEKAHWSFFDLLLQILGEGRLTDAAGRVGDFSNAIVVMTSNLGAEAFGKGVFGLTRGSGVPDAVSHFTDEVRAFLRPELFNRIDRIVPFLPLGKAVIETIAQRELKLGQQREGFRLRNLSLDVSENAMEHLTTRGYDARYGARPLKRAIERELLVPLADLINSCPSELQLRAHADVREGRFFVTGGAKTDATGGPIVTGAARSSLGAPAERSMTLRRNVQALHQCSMFLSVQNEMFMMEREEVRRAARKKPVYDSQRAAKLNELREIVAPAEALLTKSVSIEETILNALYSTEPVSLPTGMEDQIWSQESTLDELLLALLAQQIAKPHQVTVALFGHKQHLWSLAAAYFSIAASLQYSARVVWYSRMEHNQLRRHVEDKPAGFFDEPDEKAIGVAMTLSGQYASLRFAPEAGAHVFLVAGERRPCLVDISELAVGDYIPPQRVEFPDFPEGKSRREYDLEACTVKDSTLAASLRWSGRNFAPAVEEAMTLQLRRAARAVLTQ